MGLNICMALTDITAKIKFTNVKCETYNKTWVSVQQCRLRAISRNKTVLNIDSTFHYPATKINIRIQVLKKANGYKPWLIDTTIDACAFMRRRNHPVAKIVHDWIRNFSSITHPCPYVVKINYFKISRRVDLNNINLF
ncbi:uncharacterized protein Dwil_GK27167 [Drosophila willistoni]|uniref:Uncharacterized protein n=1 Tax=Drosophila willistoni TaxID=7260 RepID=A0A0Q9X067_DROWI|nr:uncharacterized protein Dwil_GK27167 [Drosophila willistoni]